MTYFSQAGQDRFVLNILRGKRAGTFLEIGSNHPIHHSNTWLLEKARGWGGIMIEYLDQWVDQYKEMRGNSTYRIGDATKIDYVELLKDSPKTIDYLQVDIDAHTGGTLALLERMDETVLPGRKFAVVTFEHDMYLCARYGQFLDTREKSRAIFEKHGYHRVFGDVNDNSPLKVFEDWWVHPDLVDMSYVHRLEAANEHSYKDNPLTVKSLNWRDIVYPDEIKLPVLGIGPSSTNMACVGLEYSFPPDTKLLFPAAYKDTFSYDLKGSILRVRRTDEESGWGQDLWAVAVVDE